MSKTPNQEKRKWAYFIGIPFQMAATIFLGYWIGSVLDEKNNVEDRWWTLGLTLLAVLLSLYQLIKAVSRK